MWRKTWRKMYQCVCINIHVQDMIDMIRITQVYFLWFPTTNLFVGLPTNFPADQNVMSFAGGYLAFYSRDIAFAVFYSWNMNLN